MLKNSHKNISPGQKKTCNIFSYIYMITLSCLRKPSLVLSCTVVILKYHEGSRNIQVISLLKVTSQHFTFLLLLCQGMFLNYLRKYFLKTYGTKMLTLTLNETVVGREQVCLCVCLCVCVCVRERYIYIIWKKNKNNVLKNANNC